MTASSRPVILAVFLMLCSGAAAEELRPFLALADAAGNCPEIEGRFVALIRPEGRALLLSSGPFPGSVGVGSAEGGSLQIELPRSPAWTVQRVGPAGSVVDTWAWSLPVDSRGAAGCVAFDKARFSSEGDLATYVQWLVEEVYLELPIGERRARPAFRLGERDVMLSVKQEGFKALELSGREGSTIAFRIAGTGKILLIRPFVLDSGSGRLALQWAVSDQAFWREAEKKTARFSVVTIGDELPVSDTEAVIRVVELRPELSD